MTHSSRSYLPPPPKYTIRSPLYVVDKAKLLTMMTNKYPIGILAELSRMLDVQAPKYKLLTDRDAGGVFGVVTFAGREFPSSLLRISQRDAFDDAAKLAFIAFLMDPQEFSHLDISDVIPTIPLTSAFNNLCKMKGYEVDFNFTGSKSRGWRCVFGIALGEWYNNFDDTPVYRTQRDAKLYAAKAMYGWLRYRSEFYTSEYEDDSRV
jgi:hypothetical protein